MLITVAFAGVASADSHCQDHPPIEITADEGPDGFALVKAPTGEALPRPGSGVVGGSGTAEDPYRIEGWCITSVPGFDAGIRIADTDSHVVIADTVVEQSFPTGIAVEGAANVAIEDTVVGNHDRGLFADDVANFRVADSHITGNGDRFEGHGLTIQQAHDVEIEGNEIASNAENGIVVEDTARVVIEGNEITDQGFDAIELGDSQGVEVRANTLAQNSFDGLYADDTVELTLDDNTIEDNHAGVGLRESSQVTIVDNTIRDSQYEAVDGFRVSDLVVDGNLMEGNREAVDVNEGDEITVTRNHLADDVGLDLSSIETTVQAQGNWWGQASGPSGGVEDACTDAIADGEGGELSADPGVEVCFEPWLESPPADAGTGS